MEQNDNWHREKTYESFTPLAINALNFVLLSNGSAIISILTFIGNHPERLGNIKCAMVWFFGGFSCGMIANITAYFMQLAYFNAHSPHQEGASPKDHRPFLWLSVACGVLGAITFIVGGILGISALQ